jgi:predicted ATP-dependent protease
MGYTKAIIPKVNVKAVSQFKDKIEIIGVENVAKAIEASLQK